MRAYHWPDGGDLAAVRSTQCFSQVGSISINRHTHRVPPQLMGIIPSNAGGFGDVEKAAGLFNGLEIEPLNARLRELNDWIGIEVVRFRQYVPPTQ